MEIDVTKLLTPTQAALRVGCHPTSLTWFAATGRLPVVFIGGKRFFDADALATFIQARRARRPGVPTAA